MSNEIHSVPLAPNEESRPRKGGALRRVFFGEQGLRSGWSALLFVAIFAVFLAAVMTVLRHFISMKVKGPIPLDLALLREFCQALAVIAATWVMARIEKRSLLSFGYSGGKRFIRLVSGALWGLGCLSVLIGLLWKLGYLVFDGRQLSGLIAWEYGLGWAVVFLMTGIFEESMLRGYLQYTLSRGMGFWWAALLLSAVFGLLHLSNSAESPLGLFAAGAAGLVFCLSLWYTQSLWWAVGFHAGWDWGQSYLYGTPDSGLIMKGHLLAEHPHGDPLWSGGAAGPEASLLLLPLLTLGAIGMWSWWRRGRRRTVAL